MGCLIIFLIAVNVNDKFNAMCISLLLCLTGFNFKCHYEV